MRVVEVADVDESDLLIHNPAAEDPGVAFALSRLVDPETLDKTAIGVFRDVQRLSYDREVRDQMAAAGDPADSTDLTQLLEGRDTWTVV